MCENCYNNCVKKIEYPSALLITTCNETIEGKDAIEFFRIMIKKYPNNYTHEFKENIKVEA